VILCPCRKRRNLYRSDGRRTRWPPRGLDTSRGGLFRLLGIGRAMSWFSSSERRKKLATGGFYSIQFGCTLPPASFAVPQKADVAPAVHISTIMLVGFWAKIGSVLRDAASTARRIVDCRERHPQRQGCANCFHCEKERVEPSLRWLVGAIADSLSQPETATEAPELEPFIALC
jgi:hypothetical protein